MKYPHFARLSHSRPFQLLKRMGSLRLVSSSAVKIVEVGPRDGLQNEKGVVTTEEKVRLIQGLAEAGCSFIEAGAFVSPKWVPQMADTKNVLQALRFEEGRQPSLACLVPNLNGLKQSLEIRDVVDEVAIFGAASEEFSQRNIACSIDESIERFRTVMEEANVHRLPVRGYVSTVIACPYEGPIEPKQVANVVERLFDLGCYEVSLGDTIGVGTPESIRRMLDEVIPIAGPSKLALHFHDTYGQALANILVGLEKEINVIDSSVAGLGGCPYAKGASGNVATEDVVYLLNGLGCTTGIDLEKLAMVGDQICHVLGRSNHSKAGTALIAAATANCR